MPNLLWWALGIGLAGHLPCTPGCDRGAAQVARRRAAAEGAGVPDLDALDELLSWPVEWTALHGIAELRIPLARLTYPTAYTAGRLTVRLHRPAYPADGPSGLHFPYRRPRPPRQAAAPPTRPPARPGGNR